MNLFSFTSVFTAFSAFFDFFFVVMAILSHEWPKKEKPPLLGWLGERLSSQRLLINCSYVMGVPSGLSTAVTAFLR